MTSKTTEELGSADYLEKALDDLNEARQRTEEELRSVIDSAISRAHEALDHLRTDAGDRAQELKARAEERATEWQKTLEDATEDVRRELGLRSVRAQHSEEALKEMSEEIKKRKHELAA